MKKVLLLLGLAVGLASLAPQARAATPQLSNKYQHIGYTWNAPNSTYPNCSATVTTSCLNNYTLLQISPSGSSVLLTIANGGVAPGGVVTYVYGPGGFLFCGTWNASVAVNFLDDTGAIVSSTPNSTTVAVACPLAASPATGLVGTPAP